VASPDISLSASVRIAPDVIYRDLEDEAVLLDLKTGTYFGLDPMGTRMWHLLEENSSLQLVAQRITEQYDVTPDVCERDLREFVGRLREKGLIEVV
jgi:hypothetical protein